VNCATFEPKQQQQLQRPDIFSCSVARNCEYWAPAMSCSMMDPAQTLFKMACRRSGMQLSEQVAHCKQSTDLRGPPRVLGQLGPHNLAGPAVRLYLRIVAAAALCWQTRRLPWPAAARLHAEPCSGQRRLPFDTPAKEAGTWHKS
jgi:hypothetical protein